MSVERDGGWMDNDSQLLRTFPSSQNGQTDRLE